MKNKILLAGLVLVVIGLAVFFISGHIGKEKQPENSSANTELYNKYNPTSYLAGWTRVRETKSLVDMSLDFKKEMLTTNLEEAATWEFSNGTSSAYIWARQYKTKADLDAAAQSNGFTVPYAWTEVSTLTFGDIGYAGYFRLVNEGQPALMLYESKDNEMFYIAYYNDNEKYTGTLETLAKDKMWLVSLARKVLGV